MGHANRAERSEEGRHILAFGRTANAPFLVHLQSEFSIANYMRIADDVTCLAHQQTSRAQPACRPSVFDWGAGYGQLSYLLSRRGCAVTSYDVGTPGTSPLPICPTLSIRRDDHPYRLPFSDASFDVVVSCGVLEHVDHEAASLDEIRRVLRPDGLLLIYNLPHRYGYIEILVRAFHLGYTHERRYTARDTRQLLERHGFFLRRLRRSHMLPHTGRGLPAPVRALITQHAGALLRADLVLASLPLVNQVCGVLEFVAERTSFAAS